jgi:hypothetical protein
MSEEILRPQVPPEIEVAPTEVTPSEAPAEVAA